MKELQRPKNVASKRKRKKDFAILWRVGAHDSVVDEAARKMVLTRTRVGINEFFFKISK